MEHQTQHGGLINYMFNIQRPGKDCARIIRPTSGYELTAEEKNKLDSVEENAQKNIIEVIEVNDEALPIDPNTKTAKMYLGSLAFKDKITQEDLPDSVAGLAHNIKDADGVGSLIQIKDAESWNPKNQQVIDYIAANVGTADDSHKIQVNDDGSIKVGSYGKFATSLNGKSQSLGKKSFTSGSKNIAFESNSHAEGNETFAAGKHSHAEGNTTSALGAASHSEGDQTVAQGGNAHTEGFKTTASGDNSHAEGVQTQATNYASHAEGEATKAFGYVSHAEGRSTEANGVCAHAEGKGSMAIGEYSHAEGVDTVAGTTTGGNCSHAEGRETQALGEASHAEGGNTVAYGPSTHAEGWGTYAASNDQHVQGRWNEIDGIISEDGTVTPIGKYAHIVGNGYDEDSRSNAHTLDWDGNAWFKGNVYTGGTRQSEGNKLATEDFVDDYVQRQKGAVDGIATLDGTGKIISSQLPSYVDDVVEVHITAISPLQLYKVTGVQTGRSVLGQNIFSIISSKNIISNFDPSIGEDLEELHIAPGKAISLTSAAAVDTIQDATGYYTISADFEDDESYIDVYEMVGSVVIATISASQPSATFYSSTAAYGSVQLQFKNNLGNTLIIKKLQVSIGEEVLDYKKCEKRYEYVNPATGEYVTADLVTPECGKIYIDILNGANKTYRWSGSTLVEISKSLVLGTTSTTAYRGDYGNTAYQHSLKTSGNPHKVTKLNVGLGNVTNDRQVKRSEMGVANGVATLDSSGRIPSAQLPSYVDDVVEGVIYYNRFYEIASPALMPTFDPNKVSAYGKNNFDCFKMAECYNMPYPNIALSSYINVGTIDIDLNNATHNTDFSSSTYTLSANVVQGSITVRNRGSIVGVLDTSTCSLTFTSSLMANETMLICTDAVFSNVQLEVGATATAYEAFVGAYDGTPGLTAGGKIYLNLNDLNTYRWSGTQFVEISSSLALGETEATAYAGNKGAQNASDIVALQNQVEELTDKLQKLTAFVNALEIVATDDGTGVITFSLQSLPSAEEGEF